MNDTLLFAEDSPEDLEEVDVKWKVLIIDDEPEVHNITQLVLNDLHFEGGSLELKSAYSAEQAREMMLNQKDEYAVAIVDVVSVFNLIHLVLNLTSLYGY